MSTVVSLAICIGVDLALLVYARHAQRERRRVATGILLGLGGLVEVQLVIALHAWNADVAFDWAIPGLVAILVALAVTQFASTRLARERADARGLR